MRPFRAQEEKIDVEHELCVDWLSENDAKDTPDWTVGEHDPFDPLVGGIVDGLLDVGILEVKPDCLDLDDCLKLSFHLGRQVAESAANA